MNMKRYQKYLNSLKAVKASTRVFPYSAYLLVLFPFFAILIHEKLIDSAWSLFFIVPFIFAFAAGFSYNTYCDTKIDPKEKNPILRGEISHKNVLILTLSFTIVSILLFIVINSSLISLFLFILYIFLWLAYSGLNIRFKESYPGPFVASFVLWSGPELILLAEYHYLRPIAAILLIGVFLIFASREVRHTIIDYSEDLDKGCESFAVKIGLKEANIIKFLLLVAGIIFMLASVYLGLEQMYSISRFMITLIMLILIISYLSVVGFSYFVFQQSYIPYILTKILLIIYGSIMLSLSPLYTLLVVWVFLSEKFP